MSAPGELAHRAIQAFGREAQLGQAIEECAELIVIIRHHQRGRVVSAAMADEIADVEIMLEQLALIVRQYSGTDETMREARQRKRAKAWEIVKVAELPRSRP